MTLEKYQMLQEILATGKYRVGADGEVYNERTGNKIGYISKSGRSKVGLKKVGLWYEGKKHEYTVAELVMVDIGIMKEKNCHMVVENISKNAANTRIQNLRLLLRNDLCKIEHIKKIISGRHLIPYHFQPLANEKVDIIRKYKRFGCGPTLISELTGIKQSTVGKYYYRSTRMGGVR